MPHGPLDPPTPNSESSDAPPNSVGTHQHSPLERQSSAYQPLHSTYHTDYGRVTHGDIAELHEGFRLLAGNNVVQHIGSAELREVLHSVGYGNSEDLTELFRVANQQCKADHLAFSEVLLLMTQSISEPMMEELISAFSLYDKHGTGFVTTGQFCEMMASFGEKSTVEEVAELMAFAEPDAAMRIDYRKFVQQLSRKLER